MSSLHKLNAANPRNFKVIEHAKLKSLPQLNDRAEVFPTNQAYLSGYNSSPTKEFNREKMIEQNRKLKKQVMELALHMDDIMVKSHKKKKYGINLDEQLDGGTEAQKLEAKKQEIRIVQLKNQIFSLKKENEYVWDEKAVIEKQNAIKALEGEMKPLEIEKAGLANVRKEQEKALHYLKNDDQYTQKIQKSRSQLSKIKEQCKVLAQKTLQNERLLQKAHEKSVSKSIKLKQIQDRIRENKQKLKKGVQNIVTIDMISQIQDQIMKLQTQYKQLQRTWSQKISNLQIQHNNRKIQQQKKLMILKQKQKEVRLNDIRMKQFRKLIVQNRTERLESRENPKEFRNKRNIKYLEKTPL